MPVPLGLLRDADVVGFMALITVPSVVEVGAAQKAALLAVVKAAIHPIPEMKEKGKEGGHVRRGMLAQRQGSLRCSKAMSLKHESL